MFGSLLLGLFEAPAPGAAPRILLETTEDQVGYAYGRGWTSVFTCDDPGLLRQITAGGLLLYVVPMPDAFGQTLCVDNDGREVEVRVRPVNDPPEFRTLAKVAVDDSPGTHVIPDFGTCTPGPGESPIDTATSEVSCDRPLQSLSLDSGGTLSVQLHPGEAGVLRCSALCRDLAGFETASDFAMEVVPVNDPPSWVIPEKVEVRSSASASTPGWAQHIEAGYGDLNDVLSINVQATNADFFHELPTLGLDGSLSYQIAESARGSAAVEFTLSDGTHQRTNSVVFVDFRTPPPAAPVSSRRKGPAVASKPVGPPPVLWLSTDIVVGVEDETVVLGLDQFFFGPGTDGEGEPTLSIKALDKDRRLVRAPFYDPQTQSLSIKPEPDFFGDVHMQLTVKNRSGAATSRSLTVRFLPVNDPPRFDAGGEVWVSKPGRQSIRWASHLHPGGLGESNQALRFATSSEQSTDFEEQVEIDLQGMARFKLREGVVEPVSVWVKLEDNGGSEHGGVSLSRPAKLVIVPSSPAEVATETLEGGDWLSTVAIDYYGEEGRDLWPYLCAYNQERGRIQDCDWIFPGEEVLLPAKSELRCEVARSFGRRCTANVGDREKRLLSSVPPEWITCMALIKDNAPNAQTAYLVMLAKAIAIEHESDFQLEAYLEDCQRARASAETGLESPLNDYFTLDENGKPLIVDHWGPEDL